MGHVVDFWSIKPRRIIILYDSQLGNTLKEFKLFNSPRVLTRNLFTKNKKIVFFLHGCAFRWLHHLRDTFILKAYQRVYQILGLQPADIYINKTRKGFWQLWKKIFLLNSLFMMVYNEDIADSQWLVPAQDVHFFYRRSHLNALQNWAFIFSNNF